MFTSFSSAQYGNTRVVQTYGHNYNNNAIIQQKQVVFDSRYFLGVDGYYSAAGDIAQERQDDRVDRLSADNTKLQAQIDLLTKMLAAYQASLGGQQVPSAPVIPQSPVVPNQPQPNPTTPVQPLPVPPGTPTTPPGGATALDVQVYNIFAKNCATCHGETKQNADVQVINLSKQSLIYQDVSDRVLIHDVVNGVGLGVRHKKQMPLGGVLPNADVETLRLWMVEEAEYQKTLKTKSPQNTK